MSIKNQYIDKGEQKFKTSPLKKSSKKNDPMEGVPGLKKTERPKSIALRGESSVLKEKRKFSGLRSRCITP